MNRKNKMIYLITNYSNTDYEMSENYIGYKLSFEEAVLYISSKLNVSHLGVNPNSEYWFSNGYETYIIRGIKEL